MDGLEASEEILQLDADIPVVAMTANIMSHDRELYRLSGMRDYVGKPFTSQELWQCLLKYFKPVTWQKEDAPQRERADKELHQQLINSFCKNNKKRFREIADAMTVGNMELAHRLAHTLKSNAGQLGKTLLQQAAEDVEERLKEGRNFVAQEQMETLEAELSAVLLELEPLVSKVERPVAVEPVELLAKEDAFKVLDELEPLLASGNLDCMSFVDNLRLIPGSEELIQQMENFDFLRAVETLAELKKGL
jgi:HPt (histidine-containing phosphotransfer) domain-containing protein